VPSQRAAEPQAENSERVTGSRHAVYFLNLADRLGHVAATQQLEALAGRRDVVSVCCVGCGATRGSRPAPSAALRASATTSAPRAYGLRTRQAARLGLTAVF
jgi:hypothetical protein